MLEEFIDLKAGYVPPEKLNDLRKSIYLAVLDYFALIIPLTGRLWEAVGASFIFNIRNEFGKVEGLKSTKV